MKYYIKLADDNETICGVANSKEDGTIEVETKGEINDLTFGGYKYVSGKIIVDEQRYNEYLYEEKINELRAKREPLLTAFDKYKSNVNYGVEFESEEQREKIIAWYRLLLELNEFAFENVPERIKYYL